MRHQHKDLASMMQLLHQHVPQGVRVCAWVLFRAKRFCLSEYLGICGIKKGFQVVPLLLQSSNEVVPSWSSKSSRERRWRVAEYKLVDVALIYLTEVLKDLADGPSSGQHALVKACRRNTSCGGNKRFVDFTPERKNAAQPVY